MDPAGFPEDEIRILGGQFKGVQLQQKKEKLMASGMFPLAHDGELGEKLLRAAQLIEEVLDEAYEWSRDDNQFDNAASDGASRALLALAARLVREEVSQPD